MLSPVKEDMRDNFMFIAKEQRYFYVAINGKQSVTSMR